MSLKRSLYQTLPESLKPVAKRSYRQLSEFSLLDEEALHAKFVDAVFASEAAYERYVTEFEQGSAASLRKGALDEYRRMTGDDAMGGVALETARDYYAVTRELEPTTVVETGVCNGVSTLAVLLALQANGTGRLYSIDYPFRADESLEEFRRETFQNYGGAAIPSDKDPGWIIPDELRSNWELRIGKSQRELPKVLVDCQSLDLFVHDSEHSHPCMMFEYELAYEWLQDSGMLLSDDITWNDAFDVFTEVREGKYGRVSENVGYLRKPA